MFVFFRHCENVSALLPVETDEMKRQEPDWKEVRLNTVGTVRCEPDWNWQPSPAAFGDFDLWYVWAGRGSMEFSDGRRVELMPGCVACLRPGEPPRRTSHDRAHRLGVCFVHFDFLTRGGRIARRVPAQWLPPEFTPLGDKPATGFFEMTLRRVVDLCHSGRLGARREAACYVGGLLRDLRARVHRKGARAKVSSPSSSLALADARQRLDKIVRYLRENPAETFRVDALAARAHYSADHFARLFSAVYGCLPKNFCIGVRLERARLLLSESDLTVDQIARNLGYGDVYFFSRQFKNRVGMPPTAWRAATRKG